MSLKVLAPVIRGVLHPRTVLSAQAIVGSSSAARPRTRRRYEPIAQIGRGGMAEVLLTMADAGGGVWRLEVLKKIWPELAAEPDFVTMFLDEARLSLRLNHPNVVQTHEVFLVDGELAIAMEYLDGQPLTRVLNRLLRGPGALSLPLRLRILTRVLAGLEHAHTLTDLDGSPLGVVHRDVSPQNVFVTYDGQVKLVDFGVAKTMASSHHTRPGAIKGKLAYMAPEQLQTAQIDRRADVFAVGVMLWEMLAQRRMWHKMTEVEIVGHLAAGRPMPPLPEPPDGSLPAGLEEICARALHTDPDRRHQTAVDLEMELEGVLVGAADSHARNLGKVVSMAFAKERAERQAIIERSVRRRGQPHAASSSSHKNLRLTAIDIPVDDLKGEAPDLLVPRQLKAPPSLWLWRVAAASGVVAAVLALLVAVDRRHAPALDPRAVAPANVASVAPRAWESVPTAGRPADARSATAPVQPPAPAPSAALEAKEHRRRRRHAPAVDENATLPPTGIDGIDDRP
jgi:serine/threonine protein kinase